MSDHLKATFAPNNRSGSQPVSPPFASPEAEQLWDAEGQPALVNPPSGKTGYTKADVEAALEGE